MRSIRVQYEISVKILSGVRVASQSPLKNYATVKMYNRFFVIIKIRFSGTNIDLKTVFRPFRTHFVHSVRRNNGVPRPEKFHGPTDKTNGTPRIRFASNHRDLSMRFVNVLITEVIVVLFCNVRPQLYPHDRNYQSIVIIFYRVRTTTALQNGMFSKSADRVHV